MTAVMARDPSGTHKGGALWAAMAGACCPPLYVPEWVRRHCLHSDKAKVRRNRSILSLRLLGRRRLGRPGRFGFPRPGEQASELWPFSERRQVGVGRHL